MALYKVLYVDGREAEVVAQRMSANHDSTTFETRHDGRWQKLAEVPSGDVAAVRQRITEVNGTFRWMTAKPVREVRISRGRARR